MHTPEEIVEFCESELKETKLFLSSGREFIKPSAWEEDQNKVLIYEYLIEIFSNFYEIKEKGRLDDYDLDFESVYRDITFYKEQLTGAMYDLTKKGVLYSPGAIDITKDKISCYDDIIIYLNNIRLFLKEK